MYAHASRYIFAGRQLKNGIDNFTQLFQLKKLRNVLLSRATLVAA